MNTVHLHYALEVERTGSISRAAEALFISQPNLSKAIRELETTTGVTIFNRTGRGVAPTEKGRLLLRYARLVLSQVEKIESLQAQDAENCLIYRVALSREAALDEALSAFVIQTLHSCSGASIQLKFKQLHAITAIQEVAGGSFDVAIIRYKSEHKSYFQQFLRDNELCDQLLHESPRQLLLSRTHPLAQAPEIKLSDLKACVELTTGDSLSPYLTAPAYGGTADKGQKTICADGRTLQLALLHSLPDIYMWTGPLTPATLEREGLVQRTITEEQSLYRDVLVYSSKQEFGELDQCLLALLQKEYATTLAHQTQGK